MIRLILALALLAASGSPLWAGSLELSIQNGRVSLDAKDVTVRQILAEWARVGKTHIVNIERVSSGPVTLKLEGVPEKQALDIILRSIPGYVAAPRATYLEHASIYERVLIMPTTTAVAAVRPPTQPVQGPSVTQLRPAPPLSPGTLPETPDPADDPALAAAAAAGLVAVPAPPPGPTSITGPLTMPGAVEQPPAAPTAPATPSNPWNVPAGSSRPGLAPPPEPSEPQPVLRPRPPSPDQ